QMQELEDNGDDYADKQKEIYDQLAEDLLGTNVTQFSENLADNLVDAWREGTGEMTEVWDNMLDDMKRDMMKKALSIALTDMFKGTFENISSLAQDGRLTQAEIDSAIDQIDAKSQEAQALAEKWRVAMEERGLLDDANPEADSGGFQSMSQDTADELNARFTALQIEGANVVTATNDLRDGVSLLQGSLDRQILFVQEISRFQQLAYDQAQERIDVIRAISENVQTIVANTGRLKQIEINTNELRG
ncbi:MAG: hypothetical protein J5733_05355, partial [Bacteroidaceae bacterium]|nr:hypothetical protein [Bacteroidaceae bacterium]